MAQPEQDIPIVEKERPFIVGSWQAYAANTFCAFTIIDYFPLLRSGFGEDYHLVCNFPCSGDIKFILS